MEWPEELLELFDDPMFSNVKVPPSPVTADDRTLRKMEEVKAWIEKNGREPRPDAKDIKEKLLFKSLETLKQMNVWA